MKSSFRILLNKKVFKKIFLKKYANTPKRLHAMYTIRTQNIECNDDHRERCLRKAPFLSMSFAMFGFPQELLPLSVCKIILL